MSVHSQWVKWFRQKYVKIPENYVNNTVFKPFFTNQTAINEC